MTAPHDPSTGIIHLLPDRWDGLWRGRQRIAAELSAHFTSIWVEPAQHWRTAMRRPRGTKVHRPEPTATPNLHIYQPPSLYPFFHSDGRLSDWTFARRLNQAAKILDRHGAERRVLMIWRPTFRKAIKLVPHDLSCYYVNDEYTFTTHDSPVSTEEVEVLQETDAVFIHSPGLMEKKGQYNSRTFASPNGVDFELYAAPQKVPSDLGAIPRPRIGYVGALKRQLDWPLIEAIVERSPEYSFVFVGPTSPHSEAMAAVDRLEAYPNAFFIDQRPAADVPAYVQHFDVCVMPYACTPYTEYIYPLKLHEYLATGNPVVSTPVRVAREFSDVVGLASSAEEWVRCLADALSPEVDTPDLCRRRIDVARQHDWGRVADQLAESIERELSSRAAESRG